MGGVERGICRIWGYSSSRERVEVGQTCGRQKRMSEKSGGSCPLGPFAFRETLDRDQFCLVVLRLLEWVSALDLNHTSYSFNRVTS